MGHHLWLAAGAAGEVHNHCVVVLVDEGRTYKLGGQLPLLFPVVEALFIAQCDVLLHRRALRHGQFDLTDDIVIVGTDDGNKDDILVWGDFWVFNYNLSGDTLKTVSGGDHPGLMHLKKVGNEYEISNFEVVEDGAGNLESAKRIFGDKYDSFQEVNGLVEKREDMRLRFTADYVKKHGLSATMLQDYGWPAVALPL